MLYQWYGDATNEHELRECILISARHSFKDKNGDGKDDIL